MVHDLWASTELNVQLRAVSLIFAEPGVVARNLASSSVQSGWNELAAHSKLLYDACTNLRILPTGQ